MAGNLIDFYSNQFSRLLLLCLSLHIYPSPLTKNKSLIGQSLYKLPIGCHWCVHALVKVAVKSACTNKKDAKLRGAGRRTATVFACPSIHVDPLDNAEQLISVRVIAYQYLKHQSVSLLVD